MWLLLTYKTILCSDSEACGAGDEPLPGPQGLILTHGTIFCTGFENAIMHQTGVADITTVGEESSL